MRLTSDIDAVALSREGGKEFVRRGRKVDIVFSIIRVR